MIRNAALLFFTMLLFVLSAKAQSLTQADIFSYFGQKVNTEALQQKGFKEKYYGIKKAGGYLGNYENKTTDQYLFINADSSGIIIFIDLYMPADKKVWKGLGLEKKQLNVGEDYKITGKTIYLNRKYTIVSFYREKPVIKPKQD